AKAARDQNPSQTGSGNSAPPRGGTSGATPAGRPGTTPGATVTPTPTTTATSRPAASPLPGPVRPASNAPVIRNQTQTFQANGLSHPVRPTAVQTYKPPNLQNYSQMNSFIRRADLSLSRIQAGPELTFSIGDKGVKFAFSDISEEPEVRPDSMLDSLQTSSVLSIPVDARGLALRWEDLTRYTDYRDFQYT